MVLWVLAAMITFDTRYLLALTLFALILFGVSRIKLREVKVILIFSLVFLVLNNVLIYLFSPEHGVTLYDSRTVLVQLIGRYTITSQQLLYQANVVLKYTATIPVVILFISTTQPSEFAASLNKIGVSYSVAYSVSLALRYIPDLMDEFHSISLAQQARGIELSGKESLVKRLKGATSILMPLILSSMERIEVVSNAMELRCFGKEKKRTWYRERKLGAGDYGTIAVGVALVVITFLLQAVNGGRYWNPFV
jgi:energy-coupling factor transport system permease protein